MVKAKYSKTIKVVSTFLMIFMLLSCVNTAFAGLITKPGDVQAGASTAATEVNKIGGTVLGIVSTTGIVISVIVLVVLGIKYMIGSASEKAEYKKTMIPYLIGAVLVFGASTIATIIQNVSTGTIKS